MPAPRRQRSTPLGAPEIAALFGRYAETRDPVVRARLVELHLPLARRLARRYVLPGESRDDLEQVAAVGLVGAVERYDPTLGTAFTTFAVPAILGEIRHALRDRGWAASVPRATRARAIALQRLLDEAADGTTARGLAQSTGWTEEEVLDALTAAAARGSVPLDAPGGGADGVPAAERIGAEDPAFAAVEARAVLSTILPTLSPLEAAVVSLRFGADLTQSEIGACLGYSQMHVSRTLRAALVRMETALDGG